MEAVEEVMVLIIGAGRAGLATAACLMRQCIPYIIVERESCSASLWRHRAYDRLKLHLAKEFCELPHMAYPADTPTYAPRKRFIEYIDNYISNFEIRPSGSTGCDDWHGNVLVVGAGNSGMEIAYDLATNGAHTSIVVRSPVHIMTKELIWFGMTLVQNLGLPMTTVDATLVMAANFIFGDLSKHGIMRPKMGPLLLKSQTGRSAVIDVGTAKLIKQGVIKVFKGRSKIKAHNVEFHGGKQLSFDAIVFATGYKSTVNTWLKNGQSMFTKDGFPKKSFPNHWRGENGLYCAGFARRGLAGIGKDTKNIVDDIVATMDKGSH
uniref:indole-3-pyruvate monooxygenase n=1 Tax=Leersia perrieri TaxID=77586 RepID=A0A0D9WXJ0_9ORYZ